MPSSAVKPAAIIGGAAIGALSGGDSEQRQTQTQTTRLDPATRARFGEIYGRAGQTPLSATQARGYANQLMSGLGLVNQTGAQGIEGYMDPYQSQVIGALEAQAGRQQDLAGQATGQAATAANAFGGSRHGIAEGTARSNIARDLSEATGGYLSQGFQSALGNLQADRARALQAGQIGLGGLLGLEDMDAQRLQLMLQAAQGGVQTTTTGESVQPLQGNRFAGALGGAATVAGLPWQSGGGGGFQATPGTIPGANVRFGF